MHFLELLIAKRPGQVGAKDFGTDVRRQLADLDGLVVHWMSLLWPAVIPDLFALDLSSLEDRPPFLDLGLVEGSQPLRRLLVAWHNLIAQVYMPLAGHRIGQSLDDRPVGLEG